MANILEITDPVGSTVELSRAITEQGVLTVLSGLMIVTFIAIGWFLLKTIYTALNNLSKAIEHIEESNMQLIEQTKTSLGFLSSLVNRNNKELLISQTKYNTARILKMSFADSINDLMDGTIDILTKNHISDKEYTYNRVKSVVDSVHYDRIKELNEMEYNDTKIGDLVDKEEWVSKTIDIIYKFIYSDEKGKLNKDILFRDLRLAHKGFTNELKL